MSSDLAISARSVGKIFHVAPTQARPTTLAELITQKLRHPFTSATRTTEFHALRDVSFEVRRGEVLGIIGRNGAGKSTLLKILSQITPPTTGEIDLHGKVGSLLEVGTGFHPELTGRENIFLNGAILGMSRHEIAREFDSIVAFAETEAFLEVPVKRYSSGMYVRLAFAVAAHLRPDILIVDEVLAVGDADFQRKCLGKMSEITSREGRTVLFVSHAMPAVQQLCTECILLEAGRIAARGKPIEITQRYLQNTATSSDQTLQQPGAPCQIALAFETASGGKTRTWRYGEPLRVCVTVQPSGELWRPAVDLAFYDSARRRLFALRSDRVADGPERIVAPQQIVFEIGNPGITLPELIIDIGVRQGAGEYVALFCDAARIGMDLSSLPEGTPTDGLLHPAVGVTWQAPS
jgi:ABC-type polysaccharide/polyol phosphate transport system ATPase subunit